MPREYIDLSGQTLSSAIESSPMFDLKALSWREKAAGACLLLTKAQGLATAFLILGQHPFARTSLVATVVTLAMTFVLCGWELVARRRPKRHCKCHSCTGAILT